MQRKMDDFYKKHKDTEVYFPTLPSNIDAANGFHVAKWFLDEMITKNIGWLNLSLRSVNTADFVPLGQDYRGRIELEKVERKFPDKKELFLSTNGQYRPAIAFDVPYTRHFWETRFPAEKYAWIKYEYIDPETSLGPRQDKEYNIETAFDFLDDMMPIVSGIRVPGRDCKLVVENCGELSLIEGGTYLINPKHKYQIINTSKIQTVGIISATARLGMQFQRFCDMIARSYFVQVNSNKMLAERKV